MRFFVVDPLRPQWQMESTEAPSFPDAPSVRTAMWLPYSRHQDPENLDTFIGGKCPSHVIRSDVVIIGLHPATARYIRSSDEILDDVATRVENRPLYLVYHSDDACKRPVIEQVRGRRIDGVNSESALDVICHQDIAQVVRRPGTELPTHLGYHYQGPNGEHYRAFLRPGFAARSTEELDRISFWMAPLLLGKSRFLVDHSSMMLIAYHIGQYSIDLGDQKSVVVQCPRIYDESLDVLVDRLKSTFGRIQIDSGAVIISVNSSGRLARDRLLPAMADVGFHDPKCIAIASTPNQPVFPVESLTTLEQEFERSNSSNCEACKAGSTVIQIQEDSYFLSLAANVRFSRVTRRDAKPSADFVNRYRGLGAFRVHVTHSTGRHHAFYIDLLPMLESDQFKSRLAQCLCQLKNKSIDLILHPDHSSAEKLAHMVAEQLGIDSVIKSDDSLQELGADESRRILSAGAVCLVDDAIVTGARLLGYRGRLNQIRRDHGRSECELYCLVGVSRPASAKAGQGLRDVFDHSSTDIRLFSVEQLFLPCWDQTQCPWCKELEILESSLPKVRMNCLVHERVEVLDRSDGITDDLFVPWAGSDVRQREKYWRLGSNSIFGEVQGADLAISVAATIQSLRSSQVGSDGLWSETRLDEVFRSPVAKVLDPEFYIGRRFYEPVLVASIFRSLKAHDVVPPSPAV